MLFGAYMIAKIAFCFGMGWAFCLFLNVFRPSLRKIPGPWPAKFTPFWRVFFVQGGNAHENYRQLHEQYGPIVRTAPNVVDISDPTAIPTIYGISSKFLKSNFYELFDFVYDNASVENMFSARDSMLHKALKQPVSQKYSMTSIRSMEYLVDPCTKIFTDAMKDLEGQVVDLGAWVQWYAFDVIGAISFSRRFGFMAERKDVNGIIAGIETALQYGGVIGQVPALHKFSLGNPIMRTVLAKLTGNYGNPFPIVQMMVMESIQEYDADTTDQRSREDFLAFLRQQQKKPSGAINTADIRNHLMNNLIAGSDTTAISLRSIFYYVLKDQRVYQSLQMEIDEAQNAGKLSLSITYAESLELKYLQAILKEALRMHPGVQFPLERVVPSGGAVLCGEHIPAGTVVGVNASVIHRNTDIFGIDANQFRPERWLNTDVEKVKTMDRNLLTFGLGVRTCIGKNISIMEMGKVVPTLLRDFHLEWASSEPEWQVHTYWFARQTGLLVRMKQRRPLLV